MNLSVAQPSSRDTLVADCAQLLVDAFADYNAEFRLSRGVRRNASRSATGVAARKDAVERIELYDKYVTGSVELMRQRLGEDCTSAPSVEHKAPVRRDHRSAAGQRIQSRRFFSSVTRKTFGTVGVDPAVEFIALDLDPLGNVRTHVETKVYAKPRRHRTARRGAAGRFQLPHAFIATSNTASR